MSLPWPPPPPGPVHPNRRRATWLVAAAAVALIALAAGAVIWAPWHKAPLAPTAVRAQSRTATSVLVSWTPARGGATVDRYLVLRDGRQVGSVPARQASYTDNGLTPGTAHGYTIVAASRTQRSGPSPAAKVTTITPSPVGLAAGQATWTTVALHWAPSPRGPVPSEYVIYSGGTSIAVVPGTVDAYDVTGLTPGTAYRYQVAAKWGGQKSRPSPALAASTLAVPLQGDVPVQLITLSTPGSGASLKVGQGWTDTWTFSSSCSVNKCTLTTHAEFAAPGFTVQPFTVAMSSSGPGYAGHATADITKCGPVNVKNTVTLSVSPIKGAIQNGGWKAWSGTLVLSSPYVMATSSTFCAVQSWTFSITGGHS